MALIGISGAHTIELGSGNNVSVGSVTLALTYIFYITRATLPYIKMKTLVFTTNQPNIEQILPLNSIM